MTYQCQAPNCNRCFAQSQALSDPEDCGAEVSFVSNGSTLIAQSPARESVLKRCSRCKCVEGTRKQSGVVVVFDVNPRNRKRYAKCRSCMKDSDERNAKAKENGTGIYANLQAVRNGLNCKRCQHALLTPTEKATLDGLYCQACRQRYDCGSGFDSNSAALYSQLAALMPSIVLISLGKGIPGSATPWAGRPVKPDIVFHFSESLIVVEADEGDGHSASRGYSIAKWGTPWQYGRDLNAEMAKMQVGALALHNAYHKSILYVRCNSDHTSLRLGDTGLSLRAQMVVDKIRAAQSSIGSWPTNSFRLALVDMPNSRVQPGIAIQDTVDVYVSWGNIQQTIIPTDLSVLHEITRQETIARKERRAIRSLNQ